MNTVRKKLPGMNWEKSHSNSEAPEGRLWKAPRRSTTVSAATSCSHAVRATARTCSTGIAGYIKCEAVHNGTLYAEIISVKHRKSSISYHLAGADGIIPFSSFTQRGVYG